MNLYEIKDVILNGIEVDENGTVINPETGEVFSKEDFARLGMEYEEGIDNLCLWVKDLRASAKAHKEEKEKQAEWEKADEKKADSIERFVLGLLDGAKRKTAQYQVNYRKSDKCVCTIEAEKLPPQFQRVKHSVEPNLVDLKAYIKAGNKVEGVELIKENKGKIS